MKSIQEIIAKISTFLVIAFLTVVIPYLLYKVAYIIYNLLTYRVSRGIFSFIVPIFTYHMFFDKSDSNSTNSCQPCPYFNRDYCEGCPKINPYNHKYIDFYTDIQWCNDLSRYINPNKSPAENFYEYDDMFIGDPEFTEKYELKIDNSKYSRNNDTVVAILLRFTFYILSTIAIYFLLYFKATRILVSIIVSLIIYLFWGCCYD